MSVESQATPEVREQALAMGWIPPERFDESKGTTFVDADEFVRRGEEVLPVVRAENRRLKEQVGQLAAQQRAVSEALVAAQEAIKNMEVEASAKTAKAVEKAKAEVQTELEAAFERGDHKAAAKLTRQAAELEAVTPEEGAEKKELPKLQGNEGPVIDPAFVAWADQHPWYNKNRRKTAMMNAVAMELREAGDTSVGVPFLNKCAAEVDKTFAPPAPPENKVEGAKGGGGGGSGSKKSGYDALPSDAKQACDADRRNFVGPGKRFKDDASYRAHWAGIYQSQE